MWFRRRRRTYGKFDLYLFVAALIYGFLHKQSPDFNKFLLICLIIGIIAFILFKTIIQNKIYLNSIKLVPDRFIRGNNTIANAHCSIKYSPNEQIIVMDNHPNLYNQKRMFTVKKGKINKFWNSICKVFDDYVTLDSMAAFFSLETNIDIITIDSPQPKTKKQERKTNTNNSNTTPKYVEISDIQKDTFVDVSDKPSISNEKFVEIDDLKSVSENSIKNTTTSNELVEMSAVMAKMSKNPNNKIDINNATESEISLLPGINIIMAKKIIEYRNKNKTFKTIEEFLGIANPKPHFISKIKSMIYLGEQIQLTHNEEDNQGRIVDF